MLEDVILPKWHLSMMIMLIACIAMDSILYGVKNFQQAINTTLWLIIPSMLIVQNSEYTWLLAMLFLVHSLRSGIRIFTLNTQEAWWLNIAWFRDLTIAVTVFIWLTYLPT
ncbi:hypothetical protein JYT55_00705 [Mariprofundus ferrooxydans]|nr:hypothetical protein [Mariprofundus ferrooxydans]